MAFYSGDAHAWNGDVPGLAATKTDWINMIIQYVNENGWHDRCGNIRLVPKVDNPRFTATAPSCNHVQSWTATP
jgi:hypothetical protein